EQERPERTDQESGGEQRNRAQQSRDRMGLLEELDRQNRGQAAENIEIIPLDHVSHGRSDDHGPEVLWNLRPSHIFPLEAGLFEPVIWLMPARSFKARSAPNSDEQQIGHYHSCNCHPYTTF